MNVGKLHISSRSLGQLVTAVGLLSFLGACATIQQVPMKKEFWSQTDRSVTVALANDRAGFR
jgi:hypothetical protein